MRTEEMKNTMLENIFNIYAGLGAFVEPTMTDEVNSTMEKVDKLMDEVLDELISIEENDFELEEIFTAQIMGLVHSKLETIGINFDEESQCKINMIRRAILKYVKENNISSEKLGLINNVFEAHIWKYDSAETEFMVALGELSKVVTNKIVPIIDTVENTESEEKKLETPITNAEAKEIEEIKPEEKFFDCTKIVDLEFCNDLIDDYPFNSEDLNNLRNRLIEGVGVFTTENSEGYLITTTITNITINLDKFISDIMLVLCDIRCNYEKSEKEIKRDYKELYDIITEIVEILVDDMILVNFKDSVLDRRINEVKGIIG